MQEIVFRRTLKKEVLSIHSCLDTSNYKCFQYESNFRGSNAEQRGCEKDPSTIEEKPRRSFSGVKLSSVDSLEAILAYFFELGAITLR